MTRYGRQVISDATGFDFGDRFCDDEEVRQYFTVESMEAMFGATQGLDQDTLDLMAAAVIANHWHYED